MRFCLTSGNIASLKVLLEEVHVKGFYQLLHAMFEPYLTYSWYDIYAIIPVYSKTVM